MASKGQHEATQQLIQIADESENFVDFYTFIPNFRLNRFIKTVEKERSSLHKQVQLSQKQTTKPDNQLTIKQQTTQQSPKTKASPLSKTQFKLTGFKSARKTIYTTKPGTREKESPTKQPHNLQIYDMNPLVNLSALEPGGPKKTKKCKSRNFSYEFHCTRRESKKVQSCVVLPTIEKKTFKKISSDVRRIYQLSLIRQTRH